MTNGIQPIKITRKRDSPLAHERCCVTSVLILKVCMGQNGIVVTDILVIKITYFSA